MFTDNLVHKFIDIHKSRLSNLEGIRALAIILVFNVHLFGLFATQNYFVENRFLLFFFKFLNLGHTGVDLFFVLSGFLIFRSLKKTKSFFSFLKMRYKRLLPVVFVTNLMLLANMKYSLVSIFDNFSLLMLFTKAPANYVNWSLTYEIYFYIFIGLWFFYLQTLSLFKGKGLVLYCLLLIFLMALIPGIFIQEPFRFLGFFWGILLAVLYDKGLLESKFGRMASKYGWMICLFGCCLIFSGWILFTSTFSSNPVISTAIFFGLTQILYFFLICSALSADFPLSFIFSNKYLRWLGNISFSFYVIHGVWGIGQARDMTEHFPEGVFKIVLTWLIGFILCLFYASVCFLWLEKPYFTSGKYFLISPALAWIRRLFRGSLI